MNSFTTYLDLLRGNTTTIKEYKYGWKRIITFIHEGQEYTCTQKFFRTPKGWGGYSKAETTENWKKLKVNHYMLQKVFTSEEVEAFIETMQVLPDKKVVIK